MEIAFAFLFSTALSISSIPIWLLIYDGYKQKNIKKGVYYVIGFFGLLIIGKVALNIFGIWLAMATPLLLVLFLVISYLTKQIDK